MKATHYIPRKDMDFSTWTQNFLNVLGKQRESLGFPEEEYEHLTALYADFSQKYETANQPVSRTKTAVLGKTKARGVLEKTLQQDVKEFLAYNRKVSDADRDNLGLPIHKTKRNPAPVATTIPFVQVVLNLIRHLRFDFSGSETSKSKPAGLHGMELAARIGGEKSASLHDLTRLYFDTHSPLVIEFEEEERGKIFWYAVRWENTTGEKGPWSEIMSVVIP
jgi:hypothetical protein